jgi:hypothetical protein
MGEGKPGPQEELLKIEGDWTDATRKALAKKRPTKGWPSRAVVKRAKRRKSKRK